MIEVFGGHDTAMPGALRLPSLLVDRSSLGPFSEGQGSDPCPSMDAKPCALGDACWDVFVGCELTLLRRAGLGGTTTFARSRLMARRCLCSGTRPVSRASKAPTSE